MCCFILERTIRERTLFMQFTIVMHIMFGSCSSASDRFYGGDFFSTMWSVVLCSNSFRSQLQGFDSVRIPLVLDNIYASFLVSHDFLKPFPFVSVLILDSWTDQPYPQRRGYWFLAFVVTDLLFITSGNPIQKITFYCKINIPQAYPAPKDWQYSAWKPRVIGSLSNHR